MSGTNATTSLERPWLINIPQRNCIATCGYSRSKAAAIEVSDPLTETLWLCRSNFSTSVKSKAVTAIDCQCGLHPLSEQGHDEPELSPFPTPQAARGSGHSERSVPREPKLNVGENRRRSVSRSITAWPSMMTHA